MSGEASLRRLELPAGLAAAAVLGLQVLLPRLFSVVLWYHLGFLAVSLAMLGFAAGGLLVMRGARAPNLAGPASAAALALPVALAVAVRLPIVPEALLDSPGDAGLLLLLVLVLAAPFALLGLVVCGALDAAGERAPRTYAATFLGGAAGAGLALFGLACLGLARTAAGLAVLPLLAAWSARPTALRTPTIGAALATIGLLLVDPAGVVPLASRKHFPRIPPERVLEQRENAFSHVTFYENPEHHGLWVSPETWGGALPETVGIAIDAWAITFITGRQGGLEPACVPYHQASLLGVGAEPGFSALVIGAGGGFDVLCALLAGAGHVTAVELNPLIVEAVRGRWREFSGGLYDDPRVTAVAAEGRAFVERDGQSYDRIVLAGVDTFAATQAGAFALAENYLYTREALLAYWRRLRPGGRLVVTRWWFEPPRQELRLGLTARAVLESEGVADPAAHLFIARGERTQNSLLVLQKEPFSGPQVQDLVAASAQRGAVPMLAPGLPGHPVLGEALRGEDVPAFLEAYPYDVEPTTDDRPFFFETARLSSLFRGTGNWIHDRLGGHEVLAVTLVLLALLALPLLLLARRGTAGLAVPLPAVVALGLGYVLVEVPLMQRLSLPLGHPVPAVAVVLVALLVCSGFGALLAQRLARRAGEGAERALRRGASVAAAAACAACVLLALLLSSLDAPARSLSFGARVIAVIGFVALPGVLLGIPFALALASLRQPAVAAVFVVNAVASALAGPVAVLLAIQMGFRATLLVAAGCYLLAAWNLRPSRRPGPEAC